MVSIPAVSFLDLVLTLGSINCSITVIGSGDILVKLNEALCTDSHHFPWYLQYTVCRTSEFQFSFWPHANRWGSLTFVTSLYIAFQVDMIREKLMGMIEGYLIVTFSKCNNPWVDKNQQTPTLTADFQIRHQKYVAFTDFNSLCQF